MVGEDRVAGDVFTWSFDRVQLTLSQDGDSWSVVYRTESPLLGPNLITYEARHRQPTHAAWDILARVSRATHDDEEGVRVAQIAARWMRTII
ncbi:hypothetical protein BH24CHL4_BH24CHL4_01640 [soil metagenome]